MDGQAQRLKKLIQANEVLASIESLAELLPQLLRLAQDVTGGEASSILLYNKEKKVLEFALAMNDVLGRSCVDILKHRVELPLGSGIAGWVAESMKSLNVEDAQNDERFSREADKRTGFKTRCILCTPIVHQDELLGVVQVLNSKYKPHFDSEDQELLESFGHLAGVALVRSELLEERLEQQKFESQLEAASRIQRQFCPDAPHLKSGGLIWGASVPAQFVGGDLYDFIPLSDGSWYVYVADVSGKGLPAALIMSALWSRIRAVAVQEITPSEVLEEVNRTSYEFMGGRVFATIILARYNPGSGKCIYALGGHQPPYRVSVGGVRGMDSAKGLPLGIMDSGTYGEREIVLEKGESMLFLTDGVEEARNAEGEFFGEKGIIKVLESFGPPPCGEGLLKGVDKWRRGAAPNDDTTIVEIFRG